MGTQSVYVGIDVAKATLDVAVHPTGARWTLAYTEREVAGLVTRRLTGLAPALVVLEATGGLEEPRQGSHPPATHPVLHRSPPGLFRAGAFPRPAPLDPTLRQPLNPQRGANHPASAGVFSSAEDDALP